ncbi:hypothetical protein SAMN02787073_3789 [Chryseobacterium vrystaatense]|uniref:Uncharacterized protein n=2 Tax=Chryseobacterium vrystaatense TaxID=307480 RepID=A0A1M5I964_9FLAO|nr:hypothetical protein SAMN02787073_3789 [Chryseobacterium vrystaatense]
MSSLSYNCKAQGATEYINFYNVITPKLNSIASNKAQFYGQNFSNFYSELQNKNMGIAVFNYEAKTDPGTKYYVLTLIFTEINIWSLAMKNSFQYPMVAITFENEIPKQIDDIAKSNHLKWNDSIAQFFADMKIEKIEFIGINGYDSADRSLK